MQQLVQLGAILLLKLHWKMQYTCEGKTTIQIHDFTIMKFATDKENVGGFTQ